MLKGNLSTRPFYNERLVAIALAIAAVLVVLLAGYDAMRIMDLNNRRVAARARLEADQREAARIRGQVQSLLQAVDRPTLTRLAAFTREANGIIDQRTFSWTTLLEQLEKTLPPDVRLVSISPRVDKGVTTLAMAVVLRDLDDVDVFISNLTGTGVFRDVSPTDQQGMDDGTYSARIDAVYLPRRAPAAGASSVREKQQ
jgi:type IV pilus assembly protein PilN